jgi:hypothetical protein
LESRISKLVIEVADDSPRLIVKRDQLPIEPEQWGRAVALDAGTYELTARAPGRKAWHQTVEIAAGTPVVTIEVPVLKRLEEAPLPVRPDKPAPQGRASAPLAAVASTNDRASSAVNVKALALGGLGVGALAFGTVMGLRYKSANDDAKAICPSSTNCSAKQIDEHTRAVDRASRDRSWMYAGAGVGIASLAGAAAIYIFTSPRRTSSAGWQAEPTLGLHGELGASLTGAF